MFIGLTLHTVVDGVALSASVLTEAAHGGWPLAGVGTFLAVAMHKPLDSFAITSLMKKQHWTPAAQNIANLAFSLSCPIGAAAFYFGSTRIAGGTEILGWGLAVSGGFFIGIALADLLPEVAFHQHDKGILTAALLSGVSLAVVLENLPGHDHANHAEIGHPSPPLIQDRGFRPAVSTPPTSRRRPASRRKPHPHFFVNQKR